MPKYAWHTTLISISPEQYFVNHFLPETSFIDVLFIGILYSYASLWNMHSALVSGANKFGIIVENPSRRTKGHMGALTDFTKTNHNLFGQWRTLY